MSKKIREILQRTSVKSVNAAMAIINNPKIYTAQDIQKGADEMLDQATAEIQSLITEARAEYREELRKWYEKNKHKDDWGVDVVYGLGELLDKESGGKE